MAMSSRPGNTSSIMYQLANTTFKVAANTLNTTLEIANKINETCANGTLGHAEEQPCEGNDVIAIVSKCPNPQEYRKEAVITFCNNISAVVDFTEQCIEQAFYDYEKTQDQDCFTNWWPVIAGSAAFLAVLGTAAFCYYGSKNKNTLYTPINVSVGQVYDAGFNPDETLKDRHTPSYGSA